MRKTIIKYYCDICGEDVEDNGLVNIAIPRMKPSGFVMIKNTEACSKCVKKIASIFPMLTEDEFDDGYME